MSSEIHKHIETAIEKKTSLLNAKVINFPKDIEGNDIKNLTDNTSDFWRIDDKSNEDQFKAVMGICFMFGTLLIIGLYSNLI
tara:strand:+ start:287 stop:532 length:246 start_codon:yes stop_codon:yes gene_type:complete